MDDDIFFFPFHYSVRLDTVGLGLSLVCWFLYIYSFNFNLDTMFETEAKE